MNNEEEWIVNPEELRKNREKALLRDNKKNTQPRISFIKTLGIIAIIIFFVIIGNYLATEDNKNLEKRSAECASEGYGIKVSYTKEGDKYYVCNLSEGK